MDPRSRISQASGVRTTLQQLALLSAAPVQRRAATPPVQRKIQHGQSSQDLVSHAARALSMPKPSMTFLIKKLEASGYLRRQGEKGDLRRYRLTITPAGIKARDKGAEAVNRIFGACLNSLSAADQATLSRIVDQLQPRTSKTKQGST